MKKYKLFIFDWHGTLMRPECGIYPKFTTVEDILFPGVLVTLQQLKQQGYKLAIATTMPTNTIKELLTIKELNGLFDTFRCADQTASKPNPLMILEILQQLNVEAEFAAMIGDSGGDMQLAHNAGVDAIAVSYGTETAQVLKTYQPKAVISDINKLLLLNNKHS